MVEDYNQVKTMASASKRPRLVLPSADKADQISKYLEPFVLDNEKLRHVMAVFEDQMKLAYSKDGAKRKSSSVLNENTYIYQLLDGSESGDYLGLDLGGSNFRVIRVRLNKGKVEPTIRSYRLPEQLMDKRAEKIFDFVAEKIGEFVEEEKLTDQRFPLGFTFSFPMKQSSLRTGSLVTWTKNFRCPNGVGDDVVTFLEDAIKRRGNLNVYVEALLCDTTATLVAGNCEDPNCLIGLIIGTGCNACFVEHVKNAEKVENRREEAVAIDIQWGGVGDNGCLDDIKTELDRQVDEESNHPNSFAFEKMISGLYLGEVVRQALVRLTKKGLVFDGKGSEKLFQRNAFTTEAVSDVERDNGNDFTRTRSVLEELGLGNASDDDLTVVKEVCTVMSARGAHLVSANLAVLLQHINKPAVTIAADGSVYENHPKYHQLMMDKLAELVPQTKVKIILCKEGSGTGAALTAAIALKQRQSAR